MSSSMALASDALDKGFGISVILAILLGLFSQAVIWCFNLNISSEVSVLLVPLAMVCSVPINLYILYHCISLPLPTWLTSGQPVAFGGVVSNICGETENPCSDTEGDGGWACFPSNLQMWLNKMTGPEGWKHLFQPPDKFVVCLIVSVAIMAYLAFIVVVLRNPGFLYERGRYRREERRRREEREQCERCSQCEEGDHCPETGLPEIVDMKENWGCSGSPFQITDRIQQSV